MSGIMINISLCVCFPVLFKSSQVFEFPTVIVCLTIIKRNAKLAFSPNAIVDARLRRRLRRHERIYFNISGTIAASNSKIYPNVEHDSLYISTGNDVTIYLRSAANRTNVSILAHVQVAIS